jgi:hypothetical protein
VLTTDAESWYQTTTTKYTVYHAHHTVLGELGIRVSRERERERKRVFLMKMCSSVLYPFLSWKHSTLVCLRTSHTSQECLVYFSERCCHAVVVVSTGDCKLACVEAAVAVAVQAHTCFIQKFIFYSGCAPLQWYLKTFFVPCLLSILHWFTLKLTAYTARRLSSYRRGRESESNTATTTSWHICLLECTLSFKCTASCDLLHYYASSNALQLLPLA